MKMKKALYSLLALLLYVPHAAFALVGVGGGTSDIEGLIGKFGRIVRLLIPIFYGLGLVVFVWGLVVALWKGRESSDERKNGLQFAGYGVLIIFFAVALSGLVLFINNSLEIDNNQVIKPPKVQFNTI